MEKTRVTCSLLTNEEVSVQDVATVALAGPAAQEHRQRRKGPNASDYLTDVMNALACLREVLPEGEATRWGRYLEQRAKDIVTSDAYWPAVGAVAKELVQHRKLNWQASGRMYQEFRHYGETTRSGPTVRSNGRAVSAKGLRAATIAT